MIAVVGLPSTKNFGDPILFQNTESLIKHISPEQEIQPVDLEFADAPAIVRILYKTARKISSLMLGEGTEKYWKVLIRAQKLCLTNHYRRQLKHADSVIFAGGAIFIYRYLELGIRVAQIVELAADLGIPVMFNSVGVEGFDNHHVQARYLKSAINNEVVKAITTRDDLETLQQHYVTNESIQTAWTPDSAWWTDRTFAKQIQAGAKRTVIGLGMIRKGIFSDNGISVSEDKIFEFWKNVCEELESRKLTFEFFTNGVHGDGEFIYEFLERYPEFQKIRVRIPRNPTELVVIVNGYSKIIASRMHTSIIAYSLAVPSLSIVWNNKIKMFYQQIRHDDRLLDIRKMDKDCVKRVINQLELVNYDDEDMSYRQTQRELTERYLRNFIEKYASSGK